MRGVYVNLVDLNLSDAFATSLCDKITSLFGLSKSYHSIVIAVNPEGTQLYSYQFRTSLCRKHLVLGQHFVKYGTPGYLAYAHRPGTFMKTVNKLWESAVAKIPKSALNQTSLILIAYSGLKEIGENAERIEKKLKKFLSGTGCKLGKTPFLYASLDDHGSMNWFAVNLLLDNFNRKKPLAVVLSLQNAFFDMGYSLDMDFNGFWKVKNYTTIVSVQESNYCVYTRSETSLGCDNARMSIFMQGNENKEVVRSPCLPPNMWAKVMFNKRAYVLQGWTPSSSESSGDFEASDSVDIQSCTNDIKQFLQNYNSPPPLTGRTIYARRKYYSVVQRANLVTYPKEVVLKVADIYTAAKRECSRATPTDYFLCFDLLYMYNVFTRFYKLWDDQKIRFAAMVKGVNPLWALAVGYMNMLMVNEDVCLNEE
ncbi:hypothetical protein RUM44_008234 [Polyplax serrata]|uniref:Uncharacterized protein n=1 Tax=Polyplax serrata TaxID=468196 RepID=A0ABR1B7Z7_POLSC